MKKVIALFIVVGLCGIAHATLRNAPESFGVSADRVLVAGDSILIDANIYYSGVTAGNTILLKEGLSVTSPTICTIVADTTAGNKKCSYPEPVVVDTGIYCDVTLSGGSAGANLLYTQ